MSEQQKSGNVRQRVVESAKEKLKAARENLPSEFLDAFGDLLAAEKAPRADDLLALFEKQAGGEA